MLGHCTVSQLEVIKKLKIPLLLEDCLLAKQAGIIEVDYLAHMHSYSIWMQYEPGWIPLVMFENLLDQYAD